MVNFDNDTTVATPPGDIVKVVVLERREQVIEALENYHSMDSSGVDTNHKRAVLKARLMSFWYEVEGMVKRRLSRAKGGEDDPTYEEVKEGIRQAEQFEELLLAFEWLNEFVDDMGLTFIDGRPKYDRSNIEESNTKKGM